MSEETRPENPEEEKKKDKLADDLEEMAENLAVAQGIQHLEITRRTGTALKPFDPARQVLKGNIEAPFEYYSKRGSASWFTRNSAVLLVDYEAMSITYETEPIVRRGVTVRGEVELYPHIVAMALTSYGAKMWDNSGIVTFLKRLRPFFASQGEALDLINTIRNIDVKVDTQIQKEDNQRGTKGDSYKHVAEASLPDGFKLTTPLFRGQPDNEVDLTIELYYQYNPKAGGLEYWFESREFEERIEPMVRGLIDNQIGNFNNNLPVIFT